MRKPILVLALTLAFVALLSSCGDRRSQNWTMYRPKFSIEAAKIPFLNEYNLMGVQLVEIDNPFPQAERKRIYSLWFTLDGHGRFALHAETGDNIGRTIHMYIMGQSAGYHPITRPIESGVLRIFLYPEVEESAARNLHKQLERAIVEVHKRGKH